MSDPSLFRLRVTYVKKGRLALLSHLEITRALERTVRRAQLPFAITNGFSPHMRIAFGAALPVGVGGTGEIFDLLLTRYVAPDKCLAALAAASADDLMCLECAYIENRAAAASVAFPFSTYEAVFAELLETFEAPESIEVVRKKKAKTLVVSDFLCGEPVVDGWTVRFTLEAKPTGSLRPDLLVAHTPTPDLVSITRISQFA